MMAFGPSLYARNATQLDRFPLHFGKAIDMAICRIDGWEDRAGIYCRRVREGRNGCRRKPVRRQLRPPMSMLIFAMVLIVSTALFFCWLQYTLHRILRREFDREYFR